jgi:hypothetical protein
VDKNELLSKYNERKSFLLNLYNEAIKNKLIVFPKKTPKVSKINFVREINEGYNRIIPHKIYKLKFKQNSYGFKAKALLKKKYSHSIFDEKNQKTFSYYVNDFFLKSHDYFYNAYARSSRELKEMLINSLKSMFNNKTNKSTLKKKVIHHHIHTPYYPRTERIKRFWHVGYFNREFLRIINIYKGTKNLNLSAQFNKNMRLRFNKKTSKLELYLHLPKVNDVEKYYLKLTNRNNNVCERYPIRFIVPQKKTILVENFEKGFVYDINQQRKYLNAKKAFINQNLNSEHADLSTAIYEHLNGSNNVNIKLDDANLNKMSAHLFNSNYSKITPAEIMDTIYFNKNQETAFLWYIENAIWQKENELINKFLFEEYASKLNFKNDSEYSGFNKSFFETNFNHKNNFDLLNNVYSINKLYSLEKYFMDAKNNLFLDYSYLKNLFIAKYNYDPEKVVKMSQEDFTNYIYYYKMIFNRTSNQFYHLPHFNVKNKSQLLLKQNYVAPEFSNFTANIENLPKINFVKSVKNFNLIDKNKLKNFFKRLVINDTTDWIEFYSYNYSTNFYYSNYREYAKILWSALKTNYFFEEVAHGKLKKHILNDIFMLEKFKMKGLLSNDIDLRFLNSTNINFIFDINSWENVSLNNYKFSKSISAKNFEDLYFFLLKRNSNLLNLPLSFSEDSLYLNLNNFKKSQMVNAWVKSFYSNITLQEFNIYKYIESHVDAIINKFFNRNFTFENVIDLFSINLKNFVAKVIIYDFNNKIIFFFEDISIKNFFEYNYLNTFTNFIKYVKFYYFKYCLYLENNATASEYDKIQYYFVLKYYYLEAKFLIESFLRFIFTTVIDNIVNLVLYINSICKNIFFHFYFLFADYILTAADTIIEFWAPLLLVRDFFVNVFATICFRNYYSMFLNYLSLLEIYYAFRYKVIYEFESKFIGVNKHDFNDKSVDLFEDRNIENTSINNENSKSDFGFYAKEVLKLKLHNSTSFILPLKSNNKRVYVRADHPVSKEEEILEGLGISKKWRRNLKLEGQYQQHYTLEALKEIIATKKAIKQKKEVLDGTYVFPTIQDLKFVTFYVLKDHYFEFSIPNIFYTIKYKWTVMYDFVWDLISFFLGRDFVLRIFVFIFYTLQNFYNYIVNFSYKEVFASYVEKFYAKKPDVVIYWKYLLYYWIDQGWSLKNFSFNFILDFLIYRIFLIDSRFWKKEYLSSPIREDDWILTVTMYSKIKTLLNENNQFLQKCIYIWYDYYNDWNYSKLYMYRFDFEKMTFFGLVRELKDEFLKYYWHYLDTVFETYYPDIFEKYLNKTLSENEIIFAFRLRLVFSISFMFQFVWDILRFTIINMFDSMLFIKNILELVLYTPMRFNDNLKAILTHFEIYYIKFLIDFKEVYLQYKKEFLIYINYDYLYELYVTYIKTKILFAFEWYLSELNTKYGHTFNVNNIYVSINNFILHGNKLHFLIINVLEQAQLLMLTGIWSNIKEIFKIFKQILIISYNGLKINVINLYNELDPINYIIKELTNYFISEYNVKVVPKINYVKNLFTFDKEYYTFPTFSFTTVHIYILKSIQYVFKTTISILEFLFMSILWSFEYVYDFLMSFARIISQMYFYTLYIQNFIYVYIKYFFTVGLSLIFNFLCDILVMFYEFSICALGEIALFLAEILAFISERVFLFDKILEFFYSFLCVLMAFFENIYSIFDKLLNFDLDVFFVSCHMYFNKIWSIISYSNEWYTSYTLSWIFNRLQPLRQWLRYNFRNGRKVEIFMSGDLNRSLPIVISDDPRLLDTKKRIMTLQYFRKRELDVTQAYQTRSLWHTAYYINKYIEMLNKMDLPDIVKLSYFKIYVMNKYIEALIAFHDFYPKGQDPKYGVEEINEFFIKVIQKIDKTGVFKIKDLKRMFSRTNRITKRNYIIRMMDNEHPQHWFFDPDLAPVNNPEFVYDHHYFKWAHENISNDMLVASDLHEYEDYRDDIDDIYDSEYADTFEKKNINLDDLNDTHYWKYPSALGDSLFLEKDPKYKDTHRLDTTQYSNHNYEESMLHFSYLLKNALDVYDFMVFNQKIYNFYLDMFGPEFAKIYYHFPGQSLYLVNDKLNLEENIRFLIDFIATNPRVLSPNSLVNRLHDTEFSIHYRGLENMTFYNDYFLKGWHVEDSASFPFQEKYILGFESMLDETGNIINRTHKRLYHDVQEHFLASVSKLYEPADKQYENLNNFSNVSRTVYGQSYEFLTRHNLTRWSKITYLKPSLEIEMSLPFDAPYDKKLTFFNKFNYQYSNIWQKYFHGSSFLKLDYNFNTVDDPVVVDLYYKTLKDFRNWAVNYYSSPDIYLEGQYLGFWDYGVLMFKRNLDYKKMSDRCHSFWSKLNYEDRLWIESFHESFVLRDVLLPYDIERFSSILKFRKFLYKASVNSFNPQEMFADDDYIPFRWLFKHRTIRKGMHEDTYEKGDDKVLDWEYNWSIYADLLKIFYTVPEKYLEEKDLILSKYVKKWLKREDYSPRKFPIYTELYHRLRIDYARYVQEVLVKQLYQELEKKVKGFGSKRPSALSSNFVEWTIVVDEWLDDIEKKYGTETFNYIQEKVLNQQPEYTTVRSLGREYKQQLEVFLFNKNRFFPRKESDPKYLSEYDNSDDINKFATSRSGPLDHITGPQSFNNVGEVFTYLNHHKPYSILAPYINVEEYLKLINIRMNMRPHCYKYWVFYDDLDIATKFFNVTNFDAPRELQITFQDPASPIMEGIIDLHHDLFFFMLIISISILIVIMNLVYWSFSKRWVRFIEFTHNFWKWNLPLVLKALNVLTAFTMSAKIQKWISIFYKNSLVEWYYAEYLKKRNTLFSLAYFKLNNVISKELLNLFLVKFKVRQEIVDFISNMVLLRKMQLQVIKNTKMDPINDVSNVKYVPSYTMLQGFWNLVGYEGTPAEHEKKEQFVIASEKENVWFPLLFSHHTAIEVIWTLIPAFILVLIALPSFSLLFSMDQIWQPSFTIKVIGNQWYWSYEYC